MSRRFLRQTVSLGVSYTLGTFNDNFFKQAILLLAVGMGHTAVQAWGTVLFSLPFVLFSAWAGWLADRYAKCRLVLAAKALEVCAMLAGGWGLLQLHWSGMLAMLFCMGASATLFSPALNGSLPELFAREDVPRVNALFKLTTTASILLGITLAGGALERQWLATEIPFGRWLVAAVAVGVAVLGLLSVFFIPCRPAAARREELPPFPWLGALDSARELWRLRARKGIFGCLCADAFFYTLSTLVLLEINAYGVAQLGLGPTLASLLPGGLMLGICAGAGLAARRARADWRRSVPRACAGIGLLLAVAGGVPAAPGAFRFGLLFACYAAVGICGSLYIVPVSSQIQLLPAAEEKGRILGTSNFFSFSGMALAGPVYALLSFLPPSAAHMLLGGLALIWAVFLSRRLRDAFPDGGDSGHNGGAGDGEGETGGPRGPHRAGSRVRILFSRMLLACGRALLSLRYRVRLEGLDILQAEAERARERGRGVLVLPNHPAFMDPALLCTQLAAFDLRPLADSHQISRPWLRPLAALTGCIALPDLCRDGLSARDRVREALDSCAAALARGENVLLYPSGGLSRDGGTHLGGNSGAYRLLQAVPDCGLVLVRTRGLWGSSFSRAAGEPVLGRALLRGLVSLLCHGLFFLPRREVRITCALPSRRPVAGEGARAYNALLEAFYDADGGEKARPQILFPWRAGVPSVAGTGAAPARTAATPPPLAAADREAVLRLLADASPLGPEWAGLKEDQRLDTDLGLDSLALAELAVQLEGRSGHAPASLEGLRTVGDCLLLAAGQLPEAAPTEAEEAPSPWLDAVRARPARALGLPDAPHLPLVMLRQARRAPSRPLLADNGRILTARAFWIRAVALSLYLRRRPGGGQRVGIMLPASSAACVAWLAVLLAGQTPVMLNWTTGPRNLCHCLRLAGVRHILTARALLDRLEGSGLREAAGEAGAAWLPLEDAAASLSPCLRLEAACRTFLSLAGLEGCVVPRKPSPLAAILFTSGSSAAPKGVPLSHDNILSNCRDVAAILALDSHDAMLAMLPPFHTLGLTGNIVLPLCFGMPVVFHANPTEGARLDAVCRQWRPTLLVAAPTFLDGMLRQARPGDLASLRVAFVGAEACPRRLYDDFARLSGGGLLCEGYGVTECSPVISLNLPGDARTGTIGRPLPSVRTAIVSVQEPRQRLAAGETGLLLVRGPNVFSGYLGQGSDGGPASPFLRLDGEDWYCTGDLVRADGGGHMTFAGRRERFVKLGGEMISLPQLEAVLGRHFTVPAGQEGPVLAVDALEEEGQTVLVLFTTLPLDRARANAVLREEGLSGLHMLRRVQRLAALPLLGSGKVDYRGLRALAMQDGQDGQDR
ncbi:MFS transporter [uncultured Desulfovibrio sp.]|uniref:MFS transporter n=1 Tax=uncultured Desulfovibrio sp. TaxID=167968 RepID=UPI00266FE9BF|nr:MFS transporter [uncultured Desulfovibrio sp.]